MDVILGFFQLTLTGEDIQEVLHFVSEKLFTLPGEINQVLLKILQIFGISIQYITHKPMNFCSFSWQSDINSVWRIDEDGAFWHGHKS